MTSVTTKLEGLGPETETVSRPELGAGDMITGIKCNQCDGKGTERPWITNFPFDVENVRVFVKFLRACGGPPGS
jgi:hypothetical protein